MELYCFRKWLEGDICDPMDLSPPGSFGLLCPPAGEFSDPGIEPVYLKAPAMAGGFFATSAAWEACSIV